MNETIKIIHNRRSTRGYKSEQLKKSELDLIIDCGLYAPSAVNTQNWHLTVIQNPELLRRLDADGKEALPPEVREMIAARSETNEPSPLFYNAPTVVVVSGEKNDKWAATNCAMAAENMMLAAESVGVNSCVIGMLSQLFESPKKGEYIKELKIPEGYEPFFGICFGYQAVDMPVPERIPGKVTFIS